MGKKGRNEGTEKRSRRIKDPFTFLSNQFESIDRETAKRHIFYLILASLLAKLIVIFVTTNVFHSFVDEFDLGIYFKHGMMLAQGQMPYDSEFGYPILVFIPILLALIPAFLLQDAMAFLFSFQVLMVLCDIVTVVCVYLVSLKIWNERTAYHAGLLYTASFSAAYFVITKYDAFPTAFLMVGLVSLLYGRDTLGYLASVLGFFTKVFPGLAAPFFVFYNAKGSSLKQEVIAAAKVIIPVSVILFLPLFLIQRSTLNIYIPIRSDLGYYSNTATFTLFSWIHDVLGINISIGEISLLMYFIMGAGILFLMYLAYRSPKKDPKLLVKLLLCAIVLTVICSRVRSPQYIVWFTPLICILAADEIKKIVSLFVFQGLAYIEFPLMFGAFYVATSYTSPALSGGWFLALAEFTLENLALLFCLWIVIEPIEVYRTFKNNQN